MYTTQKQLRKTFWEHHPTLKQKNKTQNNYNATIRTMWVDFVDVMQKSGLITETLASKATL